MHDERLSVGIEMKKLIKKRKTFPVLCCSKLVMLGLMCAGSQGQRLQTWKAVKPATGTSIPDGHNSFMGCRCMFQQLLNTTADMVIRYALMKSCCLSQQQLHIKANRPPFRHLMSLPVDQQARGAQQPQIHIVLSTSSDFGQALWILVIDDAVAVIVQTILAAALLSLCLAAKTHQCFVPRNSRHLRIKHITTSHQIWWQSPTSQA